MKKKNKNREPKRGEVKKKNISSKSKRFRLLGLFIAIVVLGLLIFFLFRPVKKPAEEFFELWKKEGIEKPNVLLITLDTTRADHIACYGYPDVKTPNLDSLANRGILFEECIASSPLTLPSHSSILTGLYPTFHGVRVNGNTALSEEHLTLAEVFTQGGYTCGAFIGAFVLDGRWGLKQGFLQYDDQFDLKKYKHLDLGAVQRPGNEVIDAALTWLEDQKSNPFFAWIHLYDPHLPYEPPEPYASQYNYSLTGLYDGEIAFMDEQIGRVLSWLKGSGTEKKTIIVIIGDHGEALGSHGEMAHGYFIYDYALKVPFLIIPPTDDWRGVRIESQVRTIDLFPTVLEMTGFEVPAENQGQSLLHLFSKPKTKKSYDAYSESYTPNTIYGWSPLHSLRTLKYKYIDAPRAELYDLSADPEEARNLNGELSRIAREMKRTLDEVIRRTSLNAPAPEAANLDRETVERLAALGYVGAPVSRKSSGQRGAELADPKDKLYIYESVQRAAELLNGEKYNEASEVLESILREDPSIPQALLLAATCYVELGEADKAKSQYDLILSDDPNNIQALIGLANVLLQEGKKEDVIALAKAALSIDERNVQAYNLIGQIYMAENNHSSALPYLESAVEIQPKLTQNSLNLAACLVGLNRYEEAEVRLKEILAKYPKFPLAFFHLGLLYEAQGRQEEALKAYKEELSLYPEHFRARFNYGRLLFKIGEREEYKAQMREVIHTAPQAAEGYLFLARGLLLESADLDEVKGLVEKGLSLAKTAELNTLGYLLLADVYSRKNQPDKAKQALEKANSFKTSSSPLK